MRGTDVYWLLDPVGRTQQQIAFPLDARRRFCSHEVFSVATHEDVVDSVAIEDVDETDAWTMFRVCCVGKL